MTGDVLADHAPGPKRPRLDHEELGAVAAVPTHDVLGAAAAADSKGEGSPHALVAVPMIGEQICSSDLLPALQQLLSVYQVGVVRGRPLNNPTACCIPPLIKLLTLSVDAGRLSIGHCLKSSARSTVQSAHSLLLVGLLWRHEQAVQTALTQCSSCGKPAGHPIRPQHPLLSRSKTQ